MLGLVSGRARSQLVEFISSLAGAER